MIFLARWMFRLAILALAGYGAKALYDNVIAPAREPSREFVDRTQGAVSEAADRVSEAAHQLNSDVTSAARDAIATTTDTDDQSTVPRLAQKPSTTP